MTHHLLAVAGFTVATVTEAIHALAVARQVPLHGVCVLTTSGGRNAIAQPLAEAMRAMRKDYPRVSIPASARIEVFRTPHGEEPADIRDSADNEALADWMLARVREACSDPGATVHASLAGGRKTMGFYLGAALQLLGRPQDRLYHVLVPAERERDPSFHYPRPGTPPCVDLSELPWVPLRGLIGEPPAGASFRQLVARAADSLDAESFLQVHVFLPARKGRAAAEVVFGDPGSASSARDTPAVGMTMPLAFETWLLDRARRGLDPVSLTDPATYEANLRDFQKWVDRIAPGGRVAGAIRRRLDAWRDLREAETSSAASLRKALAGELYDEVNKFPSRHRRRVADLFARALPGTDPGKYAITSHSGTFALRIPADRIHIHHAREERTRR